MKPSFAPDQIANLDYVIIAEPDAADVLFGDWRAERTTKTVMPFDDGSAAGNWLAQPWTIVRDAAGNILAEFPETLEFRP